MTDQDLDQHFGRPLELEEGDQEVLPTLQPLVANPPAAPPRPRWLVAAVVLLLVVQAASLTVQLAGIGPAPAVPPAPDSPPLRPEADARDLSSQLESALGRAQERARLGLYSDVVSALEPLVETASEQSPARSLEVHLLLARAYAELGEMEPAAAHRRAASLTAVGREDLRALLEQAQRFEQQGQPDRAQQTCWEILCLTDPKVEDEARIEQLARLALAESMRRQAFAHADAPGLPGEGEDR